MCRLGFENYDSSMSPEERRKFLLDHAERLDDVIYGDISQMTTNETRTLWRKLFGNSQSASPLISHLGSTINDLFVEIESVKNKKKSQLRQRTILINEKQQQIDLIEAHLQDKNNALDRLAATYDKLKNDLNKRNVDSRAFDVMKDDIEQAKYHEELLLGSIKVMSEIIKKYNIPFSLDELPHYAAKIRLDDLLIKR